MKKLALLFIFFITNLHAIIIESETSKIILQHADQDTLVLIDLDDTTIKPPTGLGSDPWFCHMAKKVTDKGFNFNEAVEQVLPLYFLVHYCTKLIPTDDDIVSVISELYTNNIKFFALTARSLGLQQTERELKRLGFPFYKAHLSDKNITLGITHNAQYSGGILFAGNNDKGEILLQLLEILNLHPKKIIFIDDKEKYLHAVETVAKKLNIEFIGIRYSGSDERKQCFDATAVDKELVEFKKSLGLMPL